MPILIPFLRAKEIIILVKVSFSCFYKKIGLEIDGAKKKLCFDLDIVSGYFQTLVIKSRIFLI